MAPCLANLAEVEESLPDLVLKAYQLKYQKAKELLNSREDMHPEPHRDGQT